MKYYQFKCRECSKAFQTKEELERHEAKHELTPKPDSSIQPKVINRDPDNLSTR